MKTRSIKARVIVFLVGLAMLTSLAACGTASTTNTGGTTTNGAQSSTVSTSASGSGKLFDKPVKLSIMIGSHASWPYNPEWKMWQYVKEATGAELDIQVIPNTEIDTKVNLIMASRDQLPDLLHMISKNTPDTHALSGAFVSILDNASKLPNFNNWLKTIPDKDETLAQRTSGDGKVYFFPTYGLHTINNMRAWMYRKDIFEKNNLQVPKDYNEMYTVAKKLKEIYPDSYPLAFRSGLGKLEEMAPQWKPYLSLGAYYDYNNKKWSYGATEDTMKEMVTWFKKMYDEKLMPQDYLSITAKSWEELVTTGKGFMMPEYIVRVDFFNGPARKTDPNYTWAVMEPPKGLTSTASRLLLKTNFEFSGYLVLNTGKKENMDNALKFVDWFYSPKGIELISWGKEGETYKVENGEKKFILDDKGTPARNMYGVGTYGLYQVVDPSSNEALYSKENVLEARKAINFLEPRSNPLNWLPLNEAETENRNQLGNTITKFTQEQISKFLLGQRPMSEWDAFVKEANNLGIDKLLKSYEDAYKRVTK